MATFQNRIMARSPYYIVATAGVPSAFGTITCLGVLAADTVTVNGLLYTAVAGAKADDTEFSIDTSDTACALDLADSIDDDVRAGTLNDLTAASVVGLVTATQTVAGTGGNATTLVSSNGTRLAVSGATFSGGGDGIIESAVLQMWVWEGNNTVRPTNPVYNISNTALTSTSADITFEIAELIRDSFIHNGDAYNITPDNYADALWVEIELDIVQEGTDPATVNNLYIAFDGFGYFEDGSNPTTTYDTTYNITPIVRIETGEFAKIPIYVSNEAGEGVWKLETFKDAVLKETVDFTTQGASVFSYDRIDYFESGFSIDTIRLHYTASLSFDIEVREIDECKYTPKIISFTNKEGLLQNITMFKVSREGIRTKRDSFNRDIGFIGGSQFQYDVTKHQKQDFNITGNERLTLNSDYVDESENGVFKQMMLSENVWIDQEPFRVTSNNMEFKTRVNDKLIQYTIRFEASNELINNV